MTILGIGCDIIEIDRIRKAIERRKNFIRHLFTEKEVKHAARFKNPYPHFAGRFAAKEALLKAFGTGLKGQISWHDIEILPDENGKPIVHLSEKLSKKFIDGIFHLSISHSKEYALATAIYEKKA